MTRILQVDDDKDHLKLFTMILENQGFTLGTYSDPSAALSQFKPNYYDLAVIDYLMPNLNGLELYKRIRDIDPSTKALSASHEQLTDENNQLQGRDNLRVIRKPITNEELLSEIDSILNQVTTPVLDMVQLVKRQ
ncbi:MAG: response regulator [Thermoproteota archaeon]|nr:response regulator [Thermoproteota archaeon]